MSVGEPIPALEVFPVTGDPGALHAHANQLSNLSQQLGGHGQRITSTSAVLAPNWSGKAAGSYHAYSSILAGHFSTASAVLSGGAQTIHGFADQLDEFQGQSVNARQQSEEWHQQIVTWTKTVNDAKVALAGAQADLANAQREHSAVTGHGGGPLAVAASIKVATAQRSVSSWQNDLTNAQNQLANAHEQFHFWQTMARDIQDQANTAGFSFTNSLATFTLPAPPTPGRTDIPVFGGLGGIGIGIGGWPGIPGRPKPGDRDWPWGWKPPKKPPKPGDPDWPYGDWKPPKKPPKPGDPNWPRPGRPGVQINPSKPKKPGKPPPGGKQQPPGGKQQPPARKPPKRIPKRALWVIQRIRSTGKPPKGVVGPKRFGNNGRNGTQVLPKTEPNGKPITYKEWDVNVNKPGTNRGGDRIVTGSDGSAWYTDDHYGSFTPMP